MESYFRHPRTTQERRAAVDGWARARRSWKNLVNSYDDIQKDLGDRCWKKFRKKQYKNKSID